MGLYGASNGAGIASGPLIAGFLAVINWRYTFFLTVAMVFSLILSFH